MKKLPNLNHCDKYSFSYRGIYGEIIKSAPILPDMFQYSWCSYLYLKLEQFSDQEFAKALWLDDKIDTTFCIGRITHEYYSNEFLSSLNFHAGITFYQKYDHNPQLIKIGCDYQHVWDEYKEYNEIFVQSELMNVMDQIHDLKEYKIRCQYFGKSYLESEGSYGDETKSTFRSFEGAKEWAEKMEKLKVDIINNERKSSVEEG